MLTAVTGISGSGKSSLIAQALPEVVLLHLGHEPEDDAAESATSEGPAVVEATGGHLAGRRGRHTAHGAGGPEADRAHAAVEPGYLHGSVRPCAQAVRRHARCSTRRYDAGRFSFNVAKGRCETCEGEGFVSVELLFMPSVYAPCPTCHGARYNEPR